MDRLLELKERYAAIMTEATNVELMIKEEEINRSWLGRLYRALPDSEWALNKTSPGTSEWCVKSFFDEFDTGGCSEPRVFKCEYCWKLRCKENK